MSIYKMQTEMGSYTLKEAAAVLCAKWIKQSMETVGPDDLAALDSREFMQNAIRDAVIVEVGRFMQASGLDQDEQNSTFKRLFNDTPESDRQS
jgi:hypothetical protein